MTDLTIELNEGHAKEFLENYLEEGGEESDGKSVLGELLNLATLMYQKGDIKFVNDGQKVELVCQVRKGSRRLPLV